MSRRVLLAGLFHETNTFLQSLTTTEGFKVNHGEELLKFEGDPSPLGGVLEVARERGWEVVPAVDLRAMPGPTVADGVVELFWRSFREVAEKQTRDGVDGIFLVLHGAMVSESFGDVEGEILWRVRGLDGLSGIPLCGVLDLHANFTEPMARYSDGLIAYRENPHTDAKEAAMDAARLLDRLMMTGERPTTVLHHAPIMWPPSGTGTSTAPMRSLEEHARKIESSHPDLVAVNVFAGFPFADVPEAGVSFSSITVGNPEVDRLELCGLSELAWSLREAGNHSGMPLEEAMDELKMHKAGPVLLVEPADNIGGGAPGDGTYVLRALVEHGVQQAGVVINDPQSVQALWNRSPGEILRLDVGGKSGELGVEPLHLEVELLSKSTGHFELEDKGSHLASVSGKMIEMGKCAVVRHAGVRVLLTSRKTPPFDLAQWRSQGIDPEDLFAIGVKAAVGHRRAYDPIAKASYTVDIPGSCAENLGRLAYGNVDPDTHPLNNYYKT